METVTVFNVHHCLNFTIFLTSFRTITFQNSSISGHIPAEKFVYQFYIFVVPSSIPFSTPNTHTYSHTMQSSKRKLRRHINGIYVNSVSESFFYFALCFLFDIFVFILNATDKMGVSQHEFALTNAIHSVHLQYTVTYFNDFSPFRSHVFAFIAIAHTLSVAL